MGKIFGLNTPFSNLMTKMFNLVLLNLLFLICCIPVITIGASFCALHHVIFKMVDGDNDPYVIKEYFAAFRSNFKQSTLTWLLLLFAGIFLYLDIMFAMRIGTGGMPIFIIISIGEILYLLVFLYIFPITGRYQNSINNNLKNSLLIAIRQLPKTILLAAIVIVPGLLVLYGPVEIFLLLIVSYIIIGFSFSAFVQDKIILKIFEYYEENLSTEAS